MWTIIIQVALQILSWILDKAGASAEAKKQFFEFVKLAANDLSSVRLMEWGDKQLEEIKNTPWLERPVKKD